MSAMTGPRPVKLVIGEALTELRQREQRLTGALAEVRGAIRAFEAAAAAANEQRTVVPTPESGGIPLRVLHRPATPATDRERDDAVRGALADGPLEMAALLGKTGLTIGLVRPAMLRLRERGAVQTTGVKRTTRYWLTEQLDQHAAENDGRVPHEAVEA
jgi:hypothetical protein